MLTRTIVAPIAVILLAAASTTALTGSWIASRPRKSTSRPMRAPLSPSCRQRGRVARRNPADAERRGSDRPGSYPAITSSMRAASSTVRVIGPAASCVVLSGMMPGPADQASSRANADEAVGRRRRTDRLPGVGARCRARRSWPRLRRRCRRSIRQACASDRTDCASARQASSPSCRSRPAPSSWPWPESDRAGLAQPLDDESVGGGNRLRQRHRPARGRHVGGVVVVLQHDGNAVQRPARGRLAASSRSISVAVSSARGFTVMMAFSAGPLSS